MRRDFEKDRDKMKREIQLDFEREKEARAVAAEKQNTELEKSVELSKDLIKIALKILIFFLKR